MFRTLLIANRGEIACRIIKTAKRLGIETIAVYSEADKNALHVKTSNRAFYLGPSLAEQSYLNIEAIIKIAQEAKADAIHPGYGFLSENPQFAQRCVDSNIVFIGPSVKALSIMASKQQAKICLAKSNIPLTPGYHEIDQSLDALITAAREIGFPLLIKAASGGGGKGMRIVHSEADINDALSAAKREALAYFSDATLILEKFIPTSRHVEVQIFGDNKGNIIHLFDRDCSLQRRHQKIIEEAPAPNISLSVKKKLYETAINVAKTIDYIGAGTVEFLLLPSEVFYFMEMNTRLQVEHPVTEAITGLDLVEWQIRVAQGESLPKDFAAITYQGHAFECRIYAEDPTKEFLPCQGKLYVCHEPIGENIRIDSGYSNEDVLSTHYDPLIAKIITKGNCRQEALQNMQLALKQYAIAGLTTNISFLQAIFHEPMFLKGDLTTNFLEKNPITLKNSSPPLEVLFLLFAYRYIAILKKSVNWGDFFAFHPFLFRHWQESFLYHDTKVEAQIEFRSQVDFLLRLEERDFSLSITSSAKFFLQISHNNNASYHGILFTLNQQIYCFYDGETYVFSLNTTSSTQPVIANANTSPMPGVVVAILKKKGDKIKVNDSIIVIEAMKMEHTIKAKEAGIIADIYYKQGDKVVEGAQLFILEKDDN